MGRKIVSGFSGKMGRLFIGGNEFCAEDWDIQETANEEDTTNTCGAGYAEQEFGVKRLEGTINATYDVSVNPFGVSFPNFSVGVKHAGTELYVHSSSGATKDGPFFALTLQVASGVQVSVPVKGKVALTIPFVSFGPYTLPASVDSSGA